jgi:thiamine kinase-like enzyme
MSSKNISIKYPGKISETLRRSLPFVRTGKSKLYLLSCSDGVDVVAKTLTRRSEPWKSLFLHELKVYRAIASTRFHRFFPRLLHSEKRKFLSIWEHAKGRSAGIGRFFPEKLTRERSELLLESIRWIKGIKPSNWAGHTRNAFEFAHGDLVCSNILFSGKRVVLVDWEHAGMKPPFFDHAFLWVMGIFSRPLRQTILNYIERRQAQEIFWANVIQINKKELRIHQGLQKNTKYKSEKSVEEIRRKLRESLKEAEALF